MQISAEARWFWANNPPKDLTDWFRNGSETYCSAGGGKKRTDVYLNDSSQVELGIKRRGQKPGVEVKGLMAITWGGLAVDPFVGSIELWVKWSSNLLELKTDWTVDVDKQRWLRKFDTTGRCPQEVRLNSDEDPLDDNPLPALGCNVELTKVSVSGAIWWTLGFEAFGTLATVENDLRAVATVLAARKPLPEFERGLMESYPTWLSKHAEQCR
jgi:hypothetical protein